MYWTKRLQKIRQARNCIYHASKHKRMQVNNQTIVHGTHWIMLKNAAMKEAKKVQHLFSHNAGKKVSNNTGQKPKYKYQCIQNEYSKSNKQKLRKRAKFMHVGRKQTWPVATATFLQKRNCWSKFFKTKKPTNQKTIPRGMCGGSLNLVTYDDPQNR